MPRPDKDPNKKQGVKKSGQSAPGKKDVKKTTKVGEEPVAEIVAEVKEVLPSVVELKTAAKHKTYPALKEKPDFRDLSEPEKTLRRVAWISNNEHLTHGEKSTAIAFLLLFEGKPDRTRLTISAHLNKNTGYSPQVVRTVLDILTDWGLMRREIIKKKGTDVTLMF